MLYEALRRFKSQGKSAKVSEAQYELGICYWRLGSNDEARLIMREALEQLTDADVELKTKILIRRTLVEISENRYSEALVERALDGELTHHLGYEKHDSVGNQLRQLSQRHDAEDDARQARAGTYRCASRPQL